MLLNSKDHFDNFIDARFRENGIYYLGRSYIFFFRNKSSAMWGLHRTLTRYKIIQEISVDFYANTRGTPVLDKPADYAMYAFNPSEIPVTSDDEYYTRKAITANTMIKMAKKNGNGLVIFTDCDIKSLVYEDLFFASSSLHDYNTVICTFDAYEYQKPSTIDLATQKENMAYRRFA